MGWFVMDYLFGEELRLTFSQAHSQDSMPVLRSNVLTKG